MIKYGLVCAQGHAFQSWFQSSAVFDAQAERGLILCPICQSPEVSKDIMAPAIAKQHGREPEAPPASQSQPAVALLGEREKEIRAMIRALRARIFEVAEDVGPRFAEEARKIHEGLVPERPIHGQANYEDARALIEDGVAILPVPSLPEDQN
ncbi:MAG TPA: DUF1178 family protein [Methylocella sp.]|nr:DUF1178 family protein [Methylocella sp.]